MGDLYVVEIEPEVRQWLADLSPQHYRQVEEKVELLAERPTTLGEPHSRYLGDGVRELRFSLSGAAMRISYWLAPEQRIVLLTVFRKTKMREDAEVKRARQAKRLCEAEHSAAHETYSRDAQEEER
ncbi:type II toxin-antitoxin system RelE/ParE family toxin [Streptomyces sp. GC420]|uniref:type II toxin-antitoxin system RelE/ParE family toxin n=1 Tax=Streptomyces sp. GC420 TaxID=2697568 RepID=UPI0014151656|nr:type II toxin-antitoxin system RelE/ParE family toxin [Streptomyces sp. GC420]NBM15116.1 type II toxin-antitoxin system RelE/ParE family toxin [Streptomyces sp. GC420]